MAHAPWERRCASRASKLCFAVTLVWLIVDYFSTAKKDWFLLLVRHSLLGVSVFGAILLGYICQHFANLIIPAPKSRDVRIEDRLIMASIFYAVAGVFASLAVNSLNLPHVEIWGYTVFGESCYLILIFFVTSRPRGFGRSQRFLQSEILVILCGVAIGVLIGEGLNSLLWRGSFALSKCWRLAAYGELTAIVIYYGFLRRNAPRERATMLTFRKA